MPGVGIRIKSGKLFPASRRMSLVSSLSKRTNQPRHNTVFANWVFGGIYAESNYRSLVITPVAATLKISRLATSNVASILITPVSTQIKRSRVISSATRQLVIQPNASILLETKKIISSTRQLVIQAYSASLIETRKIISPTVQLIVTPTQAEISIGSAGPVKPTWAQIPYENKAYGKLYTSGWTGVLPPR